MARSDNLFYTGAIFNLKKNAKNENRLCPLPYEIPGEGCTSLPRVKPG